MPQLNKGGKFVFGLSVIRPDLTIHIPPQALLSFIWASENIATNTPTVYEDCLPIFAELLNDENERVRIEAPEMFRVLGKRTPELVRPYLEKLEYIATHDEVSVVRIHAKGAIRAILSKTIKEPDAKTQNKQVR